MQMLSPCSREDLNSDVWCTAGYAGVPAATHLGINIIRQPAQPALLTSVDDQYDYFKHSRLPVGVAFFVVCELWALSWDKHSVLTLILLCRLSGLRFQAVLARQMAHPLVRCRHVKAL